VTADVFVIQDLIDAGRIVVGDGYRAKNVELGDPGTPFLRVANLNNGFLVDCAFRRKRSASPGFSIASPRRPRQRLTRSVIYPLRITSLSVSFG